MSQVGSLHKAEYSINVMHDMSLYYIQKKPSMIGVSYHPKRVNIYHSFSLNFHPINFVSLRLLASQYMPDGYS